jgi:hypothetical protein
LEGEKLNWNRGKLANAIVEMCLKEVNTAQGCQTEELNPLKIDQIVSKELEYIREDLSKFDIIDIIEKKTESEFYKRKIEDV